MTAKRVIDDHLELANIGTKTHAQIDTHIADPSAHHTEYTDVKAVDAADASNKFVERNILNSVTDITELKRNTIGGILKLHNYVDAQMIVSSSLFSYATSTTHSALDMILGIDVLSANYKGTDAIEKPLGKVRFLKYDNTYLAHALIYVGNAAGGSTIVLDVTENSFDVKNLPIKGIKNHADATLSGTPKIIELLIGATSYYFKVYPTKT